MELKDWNEKLKFLKSIILKPEEFNEAMNLCLDLHAMVHESSMSHIDEKTFEDELWEGLDEETIRRAVNSKGRTIAYGIWHSTRIEDITMNLLVSDSEQVIDMGDFIKNINSIIYDTGNELAAEEILEFSKQINIEELKRYRIEVGRRTREIIKKLTTTDMKRKIPKERLQRVRDKKAVSEAESAIWLIDFWGRKNVSGLILMPALRHHIVHINESIAAKKRGK
ncbi:DinB family protein [Clostridium sp. 'White wine YQ']|uniref:DinB family protein n=1 Tax=Clostridium sp. 'White wine YQ' TaxID=3027474 RepID=UPI00236712BE|nr:DinB family protein [Clostridium sp. 'White wine YQ']MDD7794086.1 DinB family protein [Clostridium sp. 'White wine YQ']